MIRTGNRSPRRTMWAQMNPQDKTFPPDTASGWSRPMGNSCLPDTHGQRLRSSSYRPGTQSAMRILQDRPMPLDMR
jgi:hypothetical protein